MAALSNNTVQKHGKKDMVLWIFAAACLGCEMLEGGGDHVGVQQGLESSQDLQAPVPVQLHTQQLQNLLRKRDYSN